MANKPPPKRPAISVRAETYAKLTAEAKRRGLSVPQLLEQILDDRQELLS